MTELEMKLGLKRIEPRDRVDVSNIKEHDLMISHINSNCSDIAIIENMVNNVASNIDTAVSTANSAIEYAQEINNNIEEVVQSINSDIEMFIDSMDSSLVDSNMITVAQDGRSASLVKKRYDGNTSSEFIPLSTRSSVGLVVPEDLIMIDDLDVRVTNIENAGDSGYLYYVNSNWSVINDATRTNQFSSTTGRQPIAGDSVIDSIGDSYKYTLTGWAKFESISISSSSGLSAIKSSSVNGKVYIENDKTATLVGWDGLNGRVATAENKNITQDTRLDNIELDMLSVGSDLSSVESSVLAIESDITDIYGELDDIRDSIGNTEIGEITASSTNVASILSGGHVAKAVKPFTFSASSTAVTGTRTGYKASNSIIICNNKTAHASSYAYESVQNFYKFSYTATEDLYFVSNPITNYNQELHVPIDEDDAIDVYCYATKNATIATIQQIDLTESEPSTPVRCKLWFSPYAYISGTSSAPPAFNLIANYKMPKDSQVTGYSNSSGTNNAFHLVLI